MSKLPDAARYFPPLTGIRIVAAYMVFLGHYGNFKIPWFDQLMHDLFHEFWVGVTIFFVLSGFLISYRYHDAISSGKIRMRDYFVYRFARIYPIYFIVTVIAFLPAICHCSFRENIRLIFLNLTFLRGFYDEYKFTGAATGWSLTVEETFYCLFPLIVLASSRVKIIFQPILLIGIGLVLWMIFRNIDFHGFFSSLSFLFEFTFFGRCFEFYAGIMLGIYLKKNKDALIPRPHVYRTTLGILYIIVCIGLLALNQKYSTGQGSFLFYETLINNFLLPPGIVLLFYGLLVEGSVVSKVLSSRLLGLIGKSSYVFYLIHNSFLFPALYFHLNQKLQWVFILLQIISTLAYLLIEKPLNLFIRRKFSSTTVLQTI